MTVPPSESYSYEGARVVVTGAASGMGLAAAGLLQEAGATVYSLDINPCPIGTSIGVDLRDPASIDAATAQLEAPVHGLFNCAGIPHGPRFDPVDVVTVNFIGLRRLTEAVIPRMPPGSAIASTSSVAGAKWADFADELRGLMECDWDAAVTWCREHPERVSVTNCYNVSKQATFYYTMWRAGALARQGIRINATGPGPTDTAMTPLFHEARGGSEYYDNLRDRLGRNATPEEQARPLLFLNSSGASFITGSLLFVDNAMTALLETKQLDRSELTAFRTGS